MSRRRRNSSSPEPELLPAAAVSTTALRSDDYNFDDQDEELLSEQRPQTYNGQSSALPGLGEDREPFYGPAANGVDYLRMVRCEARGIPELLSAQGAGFPPSSAENVEYAGKHDEGGYWQDGAYTATPSAKLPEDDAYPQAQLRYYEALLLQFALLRATLNCVPPLGVIENLGASHPISFPPDSRQARKQWEAHILQYDPNPAQLACMDDGSILTLLRLICRRVYALFRAHDVVTAKRVNLWIWSVLGRCPGREVLDSDRIAELRELAKRASCMADRLIHTKDAGTHVLTRDNIGNGHITGEDSDEYEDDEVNSLLDAQGYVSMPHETINVITEKLVSLDAIVTVVGEVYGQRDLLQARKRWDSAPIVTSECMAHGTAG